MILVLWTLNKISPEMSKQNVLLPIKSIFKKNCHFVWLANEYGCIFYIVCFFINEKQIHHCMIYGK